MDKYEYRIRAEEINSLIEKREYVEAVKIADTIDWRRVRSVKMLCKVSELYKINRKYEESKEVLLLAYDLQPGSRSIVYSLCELSIKLEETVQAVEYYKEFLQLAPKDTGRFILQYRLYEAQDVSLEERISVLEEYKKRDYREKWAYELAYLYHRIGLATRCVEECDELILWFGEGKYVLKAMELKMLHAPLTPSQQEKYNARFMKQEEDSVKEEENNATGEEIEPSMSIEIKSVEATRAKTARIPTITFGRKPKNRVTEQQPIDEDILLAARRNVPAYSEVDTTTETEEVEVEETPQATQELIPEEVNNIVEEVAASVQEETAEETEVASEEVPNVNQEAEVQAEEVTEQPKASDEDLDIKIKTIDVDDQCSTINLQEVLAKDLAKIFAEEDMEATDATRALPIDSIFQVEKLQNGEVSLSNQKEEKPVESTAELPKIGDTQKLDHIQDLIEEQLHESKEEEEFEEEVPVEEDSDEDVKIDSDLMEIKLVPEEEISKEPEIDEVTEDDFVEEEPEINIIAADAILKDRKKPETEEKAVIVETIMDMEQDDADEAVEEKTEEKAKAEEEVKEDEAEATEEIVEVQVEAETKDEIEAEPEVLEVQVEAKEELETAEEQTQEEAKEESEASEEAVEEKTEEKAEAEEEIAEDEAEATEEVVEVQVEAETKDEIEAEPEVEEKVQAEAKEELETAEEQTQEEVKEESETVEEQTQEEAKEESKASEEAEAEEEIAEDEAEATEEVVEVQVEAETETKPEVKEEVQVEAQPKGVEPLFGQNVQLPDALLKAVQDAVIEAAKQAAQVAAKQAAEEASKQAQEATLAAQEAAQAIKDIQPQLEKINLAQEEKAVEEENKASTEHEALEQEIEKQITGQISLDDIMAEWEKTKKENEEKHLEEMKNRVSSQTGPIDSPFIANEAEELNTISPVLDVFSDESSEEKLVKEVENALVEDAKPLSNFGLVEAAKKAAMEAAKRLAGLKSEFENRELAKEEINTPSVEEVKPESVVEEVAETKVEPVVEEAAEMKAEPVVKEASEIKAEPVVEEATEIKAEPVVEEAAEMKAEPMVEEASEMKAEPKEAETEEKKALFNTAEINGLEEKLMISLEDQHYDTANIQVAALEEEISHTFSIKEEQEPVETEIEPVVEEKVTEAVVTPIAEKVEETVAAPVVEEVEETVAAPVVEEVEETVAAPVVESVEEVIESALEEKATEPEAEEKAMDPALLAAVAAAKKMAEERAAKAATLANQQQESSAEGNASDSVAAIDFPSQSQVSVQARTLTKEEKSIFDQIAQTKESEEQIAKAIDTISFTPLSGNVIITGEAGAGALDAAKAIVKNLTFTNNAFSGNVAIHTGDGLSQIDLDKTLNGLNNGVLIVNEAASLNEATVNKLLKSADELEEKGILIIFVDEKAKMDQLLTQIPSIRKCVNGEINIESLNTDGLVNFGKEYARQLDYSIDEMGVLALYNRIEERQTLDHAVTVEEVKQIINEAIEKSEKKNISHFMDVIFAKRYDKEDMIVLREKDFLNE